ncbi:MAG: LysR family transcriptional regulator [Candidatus Saccharibacteria bacterium]|nr:LysR family transcriptional regulator [Moraxellaceae bacterium]
MLDSLRSMAIFVSVVDKGSFSGAARELRITTSAVSQQIRILENDVGAVLLHRSTRKLSLTEAGGVFYESCNEMVQAAKKGRVRINELRDELVGDLRIATTPELGLNHILPALSEWLQAHPGLKVHFEADNRYIDLIEERIDIAVRLSPGLADSTLIARPMAQTHLVLLASSSYLDKHSAINTPDDLEQHEIIGLTLAKDPQEYLFRHRMTGEEKAIRMPSRIQTNNVFLMSSLVTNGHGLGALLSVDLPPTYAEGGLVEVLPDWELQPNYTLYAITQRREQPLKVVRCIETLMQYFSQVQMV